MSIAFVVAGLILLALGAEVMIRGAAALGVRFGVSPLWIGIVLVGFGTSTPELLASLRAASAGSPGLALGNVVGSNIANILLILGIAALIRPLATTAAAFRRDTTALLASALCVFAAVQYGVVDRLVAFLLMFVFVAYLVQLYRAERGTPDAAGQLYKAEADFILSSPRLLMIDAAMFVGGLIALLGGTELLVTGATNLAKTLGVSESVIGLTVVAVGTSVPELTTSVIAAVRGKADISFGNIIGSNIFNALAVLGITGLVAPFAVPIEIAHFDIWVMVVASGLLAVFAYTNWTLARWEAGFFLVAYGLYMAVVTMPSFREFVVGN